MSELDRDIEGLLAYDANAPFNLPVVATDKSGEDKSGGDEHTSSTLAYGADVLSEYDTKIGLLQVALEKTQESLKASNEDSNTPIRHNSYHLE